MTAADACGRFQFELAAQEPLSAELREHLSQCEACCALLDSLESQREALGELKDPPGFEEALSQLHERVLAATAAPVRSRRRFLLWATAASFLVLAAAAWSLVPAPRRTSAPILPSQARITPPAPASAIPAPRDSAPPVPMHPRHKPPARPYDPVRVARRILESGGPATRTVLIQQSPQIIIYWVQPLKETSHEL